MKIFTTKTNYTKTAFAFLAVLFCFMMKSEVGLGQTVVTNPASPWTVPAGVSSITVQCWGGGGGGGGDANTNRSASGGGGGAYSTITLNVSSGSRYYLNIGSGGTAGTSSSVTGGTGTTTWFNSSNTQTGALALAVGGSGGTSASTANGNGGLSSACIPTAGAHSGGDGGGNTSSSTNYRGGGSGGSSAGNALDGNDGSQINNGTSAGATAPAGGGNGGSSGYQTTTPNAGTAPGGGGGGASNGKNQSGGTGGQGQVIITYTIAAPAIGSFTPTSACLGTTPTVTITGTNFTGATAVKFNGVNATSFTVVNATSITAVLPASGVTTGPITVTTPGGTASSSPTSFTVYATPVATISTTPLNYCGTLTSGSLGGNTPTAPATGAWSQVSGPGTSTFSASTSGSSTATATAYGTYVYRWTVSNGTCTAATADVTVNYYATPVSTISTTPLNYCGTLTSGSLGGNTPTAPATGAWSQVSGPGTSTFSASTSGSSTATATAYGTYVYRWTVSNGTCTAATADVTVNYYATPVSTISTTPLNYCGTLTSGSLGGNTPTAPATGAWTQVSGPGTSTFSASTSGSSTATATAYGTYVYRWTVSNGICTAATADVTVNYYATPVSIISTTPLNYCGTLTSGSLGGNTPTAPATGAWTQVSGPGTASFSAPTSENSTATVSVSGTYVFRWTVSNGTCTPASADVTVNYYDPVVINTDPGPATQTICAASNVVYTVGATGSGLTYQWLFNGNPMSDAGRISGTTTNTLHITGVTLADDGDYSVRVIGTAPCGLVTSAAAHLDVDQRIAFTAQPLTPQTICQGQPYDISATATGTVSTAIWNYNGSFYANATISGNTYSLDIPAVVLGDAGQYRLVLDDGGSGCSSANSNIAVLNVNTNTTTTDPLATQTVCQNATVTALSVTASGTGPFTYQWYSNTTNDNTTGTSISGASSFTYTPPATTAGTTYYYVIVTGNCNSATSATGAVIVNPSTIIGTQPATTTTYCQNGTATALSVSATGTGTLTYKWYSNTVNNNTSGSVIAGAINSTYTPSTAIAGTLYYYVIVTGGCGTATSSTATVIVNPSTTISTQPAGATYCQNGTATALSVTAAGTGTLTYQWYSNTINNNTSGTIISGQTSSTYTPSTVTAGTTYYYVIVTSGCGSTTSNTAAVLINPSTIIGTQPATTTTYCQNGTATALSVSATGTGTLTYKWYSNTVNNNTSGSVIAGATNSTYTPSTATAGTLYYYVIVTGGCGTATSSTATIIINPSTTISTQPAGATYCQNGTATALSVTAAGTGTLTYQWYSNTINNNTSGTIISGQTSSTYTPSTVTAGTTYYYVIVTSGCGSTTSNTAAVLINPSTIIGTQPATTTTYCQNGTATALSVSATGTGTLTYKWYSNTVNNNTSGSVIAGATNSTYTPSTATAGTLYYYVTVTGGCGTATSSTATIIINPSTTISTQPAGATYCQNGTATALSVTAAGTGTLTYQWYSNTINNNTSGTIISGQTSSTYTPSTVTAGTTYYYVIVTGGCGSTTSNTAKIVISPITVITTNPSGNTYCQNGTATALSVSATGTGTLTYKWYSNTVNNNTSGSVIAGATNSTYTPSTATAGTLYYYVTVTGGCGTATSSTATIIVNPLPTITTTGVVAPRCFSASAQTSTLDYTGTAQNPITYSIDWVSGLTDVTNITLPASPITISIPAGRAAGTYTGTLTVKNANGCVSDGVPVSIKINALPTPTLTNSPAGPVCANTYVTYTTDASQSNYVWTFSGNAGTDYTLVSGGNNTSNTAVVSWITSGTKTVTVNYNNSNGCAASTPKANSITVLAVPTGSIVVTENSGTTPNDNIICAGDPVTFTAPAGYGSYIFYRVGAADTVQRGTNNVYSTTTLINGDQISVLIANSNNCGATLGPITITVNPLPTPTLNMTENSGAPNNNIICPNASVTYNATGGTTYFYLINGSVVATNTSGVYTTTSIATTSSVAVIAANSNGCQDTSAVQTITVSPVPSGTLTSNPTPASICTGVPITFTATAIAGATYEFFADGVSQGAASASYTFTTSSLTNGQVVTVVVTNASGCSTTFNPISVTVYQLPSGSITVTESSGISNNDNIICAGDNVKFTATSGFTHYTFYLKNTTTILQDGSSNVLNTTALVNGDYVTVVVTNGNNCTSTFPPSATITVKAIPTGTLSVSPSNTICASDNVTFTADAGFSGYKFQVNGVTVQNGTSNTYSSNSLANNDVVSVIVSNNNGCTSTFNTIKMTVNPLPSGTLAISENSGKAPDDGIICTGAAVTFTAPAGFTNYNFLVNGVSAQNGASRTYGPITTLANGDKVTVAVTNSGSCTALLNAYSITVNSLPAVAPITGNLNVCENGGTTTLSDNTPGGTWTSEDATKATVDATTGIVTGVAAGTVNIDYTYTNTNGCSKTVTATVTVHALPAVAAITGNFNICTNTYSPLNDQTPGGVWASSDNSIVSIVNQTGLVEGNSAGTATVSYTVTDANNCSTTVSADINVALSPSVAPITTTAPSGFNVCVGGTIPLKDATSGGTWSSNNPSVADVSPTGVVTGYAAGTATITYTINPTCGGTVQASQDVLVHAPPTATISYIGAPFCTTAGAVSVSKTGSDGDGSVGTYSASPAGLTIDASTGTITPSTSTPGTYTVTYKIAASGGCGVYTTTTQVTITQAPSAAISYAGTPYCSNAGTATVTLTGTGGGTYTKTAGVGTLSLNSSTGAITLGTSTPGTYTVTYTIIASGGCAQFTSSAPITITQAPSATISYAGSPYCSNAGTATVTQTGTAGGTYSASPAGLTINSSTGAITPSTSTAGTYTVTYKILGSGGCADYTTTTTVVITTAPTAVAGPDMQTCSNSGAVNITGGSSATNYSSIIWTSSGTGTFANANSLTTATYTPSAADITAGSVILTLKANGNGNCAAAVSTKKLTINPPPPAPTVTPTSATICQGDIQPLTAGPAPTTGNATNSFSGSISIPDNSATGAVSTLVISGIPVGAVINSVSVNFNITHTYDGDLRINLKAPNGNVLNLVDEDGGGGNNFNNTTISSTSGNPLRYPFTGTFAPDAVNGVAGATSGGGNTSNVTSFAGLYSVPNGTWQFSARDVNRFDVGNITSWSITINYTVTPTPTPVVWSPNTDLYTDAAATTAYAGQTVGTVYLKPSSVGVKTYTATATNSNGCSSSTNISITVKAAPTVSITSDYCAVAGKVVLTATHSAGSTVIWDNGKTTDTIQVDVSGDYTVTATSTATGCTAKATLRVAQELAVNGDFEAGSTGFSTGFPNKTGIANGLNNPPGYAVDTAANYYGRTFLWGKDHTTGHGKFMMINGSNALIWQDTVTVLPNTTYYFSAWGLELDDLPSPPTPANALLQFNINGTQVGTLGNLPRPPRNPQDDSDNNQWVRFYGTWTAGPTTTTAVVSITDLQNAVYGNNFGLDDISFSTLSTFITLKSDTSTDNQTVCVNNPINDIIYSVGTSSSAPLISGLPPGVDTSWDGELLTISGTPTVAGNYTYTITTTGTCRASTATGTITVNAQKITLSSGQASPSVCLNTAMAPNIVYTLSGTANNATVTGLPPGVNGSYNSVNKTFTISGTPTSTAGSPYHYVITTSGGSCDQATASGDITVTAQTISLNAGDNDNQTVCINSPLANIRYTVGGTATGAGVTGLPPGVTGSYAGGIFTIKGTPTDATGSPYTYTITTTGPSCSAATVTGKITVTPAATFTLTSGAGTDAQLVCKGTAIVPITYSIINATDANATGLPAGVSGSASGGVFTISGTPTAPAGTYNYTIQNADGCGMGSTTGSITVQAQTISLDAGSRSPSVCNNLPMADIVFKIGGTATGATISGQPNGVTGTISGNLFTINGTPNDAVGQYHYIVITSGSCDPVTDTGTITITAAAIGGNLTSPPNACSSGSGTLTLQGQVGTIVRWESSTNNFITVTPIANTTVSLSYSNITTPTQFRVVVSNSCGNVYSSVATVGLQNYWVGVTSDDWSDPTNWSGNKVADLSCPMVTIPAGTPHNPVIYPGTNAVANSLTINSGASLTMNGSGNLTISSGGAITNNGSFTANAGTGIVTFLGAGAINGSPVTNTFNNITTNGAFNLVTAPIINGNFQINSGIVSGISPTYGNTSTLVYNTAGAYTTGLEWNAGGSGTITPGSSIPQNVTIQSGTITIPNLGGTNRALAGNMNISAGAILQMTVGSRDLFVAGNWANSGTFTANGRKVTFDASSGTQTVSGNTTFFDLTLDNTGATTNFSSSIITVNDEFRISHGTMNGGTSTFIFSGNACTIEGVGTKNFYNLQINSASDKVSDMTSSAGNTHVFNDFVNNGIFNQHSSHTFYFDKTGATETMSGIGATTFGKLVIGDNTGTVTTLNCTANFAVTGGSMTFYKGSIYNGNDNSVLFTATTPSIITGTGTANFSTAITDVSIDLAAVSTVSSTIKDTLRLNTGGSIINNHAPIYGNTATLVYNTTTVSLPTNIEWTNNTNSAGGAGAPSNVSVTNTNSVQLLSDRTVPGALTLSAGSLDINGKTLTVNGGFPGAGGVLRGSGVSNLIAGGAGTINFDPSFNVLKNFTINNAANLNLGNALKITPGDFGPGAFGTVIANGNGILNANGFLTLRSGRYGDAVVGNSSGTINGDVTVERFFPERRAWRFVTAPVKTNQTINEAWQEGQVNTGFGPPPNTENFYPGFGTEITYDNIATHGYDYNTQTSASIHYWDSAKNSFLPLPATFGTYATKVNDFPGYYLFVRGSRAIDLSKGIYAGPDATVLRVKGTVAETGNNANKVKRLIGTLPANNYVMVGNPYASPINLSGILDGSRAGTSGYNKSMFWVWDPKLAGTYGVGAYVSYSNGVWAPIGGSYNAGDPAVIQSGQAFMVQLDGSSNASLEFQQGDKNTGERNVFGKQQQSTQSVFYTNLMSGSGSSLAIMDGVASVFGKDNAPVADKKNASKKWNQSESIGLYRDSNWNAIEFRPIPILTDTIFYYLNAIHAQAYTLQVTTQNISADFPQAWLVDKYLNTKTTVIPGTPLLYNFTATSDANTYRNRFILVFKRQFVANPVPVTKVTNQANPGITGNANSITESAGSVNVHPNPVKTGEKVILEFSNMNKGRYQVTVTNTLGKALTQTTIEHNGGNNIYSLQTDARWAAGSYFVQITGENSFSLITKLVISK